MATKMMDIALEDDDLKITAGGDFEIVESTQEHQRQLVLNGKGDFKEFPDACVDAEGYVDDDGDNNGLDALINAIVTEFINDGMSVESVAPDRTGQIISKAEY